MKKFIKILLLLMMSTLCMAQKSHLDSLKQALKVANTDSAHFISLFAIGDYYHENNRDSALLYFDKANIIAEKNHKPLDQAIALSWKGFELIFLKKYSESLESLQQAINLAENAKNENSWYHKNNYNPHEMHLWVMGQVQYIFGLLMINTGNDDRFLYHMQQSKNFATTIGDLNGLGMVNSAIGLHLIFHEDLDKALILFKDAERLLKKAGNKYNLGILNSNLALLYFKKGNNLVGWQYVRNAIKIDLEIKGYENLSDIYLGVTDFYLSKKLKDSSLFYAKKAIEILKSIGSKNLDHAYTNLYKSYKLLGKSDSAYKYQELALIALDSSFKATTKSLENFQKLSFKAQMHASELEKEKAAIQSRNRTFILLGVIAVFMLLATIFYRNNRQKQIVNKILSQQKEQIESQRDHLESALSNLKSTQTQLIQSEKMASLGELTAGIAHEIQNPLNFVNNFSEVNKEMIEELEDELKSGNIDDALLIAADIKQNEEKINHHGKRADAIVKGMLEHSRAGSGVKEPTDINKLADEYLRLSYHGLRAKDKTFNAEMVTNFDEKLPLINVIPQDIGRVILNLFNNAFYAVNQKAKTAGADYNPTVVVETFYLLHLGVGGLKVKDNGIGIPDAIKDKIMQPFFTTKPTGEGTGLGLSLTYDMVVKGHGGKIEVNSKDGEGSEFIVQLPIA